MTPLELLAVGVIVVAVFVSGVKAERNDSELSFYALFPLFLGVVAIFLSILWLCIKEAAK